MDMSRYSIIGTQKTIENLSTTSCLKFCSQSAVHGAPAQGVSLFEFDPETWPQPKSELVTLVTVTICYNMLQLLQSICYNMLQYVFALQLILES